MADERYRTQLTGAQVDDALQQLNQRVAEGWAVGTRDGSPVGSGSEYYHNNAKYYAGISGQAVEDANAAAARAEAAVPAGTAGAVFFDRAQSLTDTQKEQARGNINAANNDTSVQVITQTFTSAQQEIARANIAAGSTNPNLLDNPWFTVNQRSAATLPVGGYGVDRWKGGSAGSVTVASGGLQFVGKGNAYQIPPSGFWDSMTGKTVTASLLFSDGTVQGGSGVIGSGVTEFGTYNGVRIFKSSSNNFNLESNSDANCIVRAVKLELGSVSTLANDTPPDYGTELLKCQRYFVRLKKLYTIVGTGYALNATTPWFFAPTPVPLRDGVALTSAISGLYVAAPSGFHAVSAIAIQNSGTSYSASGVFFNATTTGLSSGEVCVLQIRDASGYLDFSADL